MTMPINQVEYDPESHHKQLLCVLADRKQMFTLAQIAKDAKYFCTLCGRVATEADYVCAPVELLKVESAR